MNLTEKFRMAAAIGQAKLTPREKHVLTLALLHQVAGKDCTPGDHRLAVEMGGYGNTKVMYSARQKAMEAGLIEVERDSGNAPVRYIWRVPEMRTLKTDTYQNRGSPICQNEGPQNDKMRTLKTDPVSLQKRDLRGIEEIAPARAHTREQASKHTLLHTDDELDRMSAEVTVQRDGVELALRIVVVEYKRAVETCTTNAPGHVAEGNARKLVVFVHAELRGNCDELPADASWEDIGRFVAAVVFWVVLDMWAHRKDRESPKAGRKKPADLRWICDPRSDFDRFMQQLGYWRAARDKEQAGRHEEARDLLRQRFEEVRGAGLAKAYQVRGATQWRHTETGEVLWPPANGEVAHVG